MEKNKKYLKFILIVFLSFLISVQFTTASNMAEIKLSQDKIPSSSWLEFTLNPNSDKISSKVDLKKVSGELIESYYLPIYTISDKSDKNYLTSKIYAKFKMPVDLGEVKYNLIFYNSNNEERKIEFEIKNIKQPEIKINSEELKIGELLNINVDNVGINGVSNKIQIIDSNSNIIKELTATCSNTNDETKCEDGYNLELNIDSTFSKGEYYIKTTYQNISGIDIPIKTYFKVIGDVESIPSTLEISDEIEEGSNLNIKIHIGDIKKGISKQGKIYNLNNEVQLTNYLCNSFETTCNSENIEKNIPLTLEPGVYYFEIIDYSENSEGTLINKEFNITAKYIEPNYDNSETISLDSNEVYSESNLILTVDNGEYKGFNNIAYIYNENGESTNHYVEFDCSFDMGGIGGKYCKTLNNKQINLENEKLTPGRYYLKFTFYKYPLDDSILGNYVNINKEFTILEKEPETTEVTCKNNICEGNNNIVTIINNGGGKFTATCKGYWTANVKEYNWINSCDTGWENSDNSINTPTTCDSTLCEPDKDKSINNKIIFKNSKGKSISGSCNGDWNADMTGDNFDYYCKNGWTNLEFISYGTSSNKNINPFIDEFKIITIPSEINIGEKLNIKVLKPTSYRGFSPSIKYSGNKNGYLRFNCGSNSLCTSTKEKEFDTSNLPAGEYRLEFKFWTESYDSKFSWKTITKDLIIKDENNNPEIFSIVERSLLGSNGKFTLIKNKCGKNIEGVICTGNYNINVIGDKWKLDCDNNWKDSSNNEITLNPNEGDCGFDRIQIGSAKKSGYNSQVLNLKNRCGEKIKKATCTGFWTIDTTGNNWKSTCKGINGESWIDYSGYEKGTLCSDTCIPKTCSDNDCGKSISNGCGETINCPVCSSTNKPKSVSCINNYCSGKNNKVSIKNNCGAEYYGAICKGNWWVNVKGNNWMSGCDTTWDISEASGYDDHKCGNKLITKTSEIKETYILPEKGVVKAGEELKVKFHINTEKDKGFSDDGNSGIRIKKSDDTRYKYYKDLTGLSFCGSSISCGICNKKDFIFKYTIPIGWPTGTYYLTGRIKDKDGNSRPYKISIKVKNDLLDNPNQDGNSNLILISKTEIKDGDTLTLTAKIGNYDHYNPHFWIVDKDKIHLNRFYSVAKPGEVQCKSYEIKQNKITFEQGNLKPGEYYFRVNYYATYNSEVEYKYIPFKIIE